MKILHTADWHLGKTIMYTGFELLPLEEKILNTIIKTIEDESVDIVLIGGDVFDSPNPSGKAERVFTKTLKTMADLNCPVFIIAGNHDSPERLAALNPLSQEHLIFIGGFVRDDFSGVSIERGRWRIEARERYFLIDDRDKGEKLVLHLLPYASEYRLGEAFFSDSDLRELEYAEKIKELVTEPFPFDADLKVLLSHLFVKEAKANPKAERPHFIGASYHIPTSYFPESYDVVALGHLHSPQIINNSIVYSGSILPFTPDLKEAEKYVYVIELEKDKKDLKKIPLNIEELIEIRVVSSMDEALEPVAGDRILYLLFKDLPSHLLPDDIKRLERAHEDRLAVFSAEIKGRQTEDDIADTNIDNLSPREWFKRFYISKKSEEPPDDVMDLFLKLAEDEEAAL